MTPDPKEIRKAVIMAIRRQIVATFRSIHEEIGGGAKTYRAVDRALQHHRKAGRIRYDGKFWRMGL